MHARENRALGFAVLLSILLHATVLLVHLPALKQPVDTSAAPPAPLNTRLVEPEPPAEPEKSEPPRQPSVAARPAPAPQAEAMAPPAPQAPAAAVPAQPAPQPPSQAAPAAPGPAPVAKSEPQAAPSAAARELPLAQSIAQYRLQVIGAASAFNRYPPLARENNWEGTVEVLMRIRGDGALGALSVKTSSGHSVLDQRALDMFRQAQQVAPVPPALRGREFTIELKAIYRLRDQDSG